MEYLLHEAILTFFIYILFHENLHVRTYASTTTAHDSSMKQIHMPIFINNYMYLIMLINIFLRIE